MWEAANEKFFVYVENTSKLYFRDSKRVLKQPSKNYSSDVQGSVTN